MRTLLWAVLASLALHLLLLTAPPERVGRISASQIPARLDIPRNTAISGQAPFEQGVLPRVRVTRSVSADREASLPKQRIVSLPAAEQRAGGSAQIVVAPPSDEALNNALSPEGAEVVSERGLREYRIALGLQATKVLGTLSSGHPGTLRRVEIELRRAHISLPAQLRITRTSGDSEFDRRALDTLAQASRTAELPASLRERVFVLPLVVESGEVAP